jgi:hypothetical protein
VQPLSANREDDARWDIRVRGFWTREQNAFFDIRIFYPHAESYLSRSPAKVYSSLEKQKKRQYADRIIQVERGSFTPLIFSTSGGAGQECQLFIKKLATLVAEKTSVSYSRHLGVLRTRISFALVRSAIMCLRGTRRRRARILVDAPSSIIAAEARVLL